MISHVLNETYKLEPKVKIKNNVAVTKHSTVLNMDVLKSFCKEKYVTYEPALLFAGYLRFNSITKPTNPVTDPAEA